MTEFRLEDYDELIQTVLDSDGEFHMYPKGTSMLPLIRQNRDGIALVKPPERCRRYDIAFYRRTNGQYVLHRVMKVSGDTYTMCGDNQLMLEPGVKHTQVIGIVSRITRDEKELSLRSLSYRLYLLIWCKSLFLRKVLMKTRRLLSALKRKLTK